MGCDGWKDRMYAERMERLENMALSYARNLREIATIMKRTGWSDLDVDWVRNSADIIEYFKSKLEKEDE